MPTKDSLLLFRDKINKIDKNIIKLLAERKDLVLEIAQSKIKNQKEIRDLEREKNMLHTLTILGKKKHLHPEYITRLFQLIIEESVLIQKQFLHKFYKKHNVTCSSLSVLGPQGSYSHIAACKYANYTFQKYTIQEHSTFENVVQSVEAKKSDYAIIPIENTCSGYIKEVVDLLNHTNLFIVGEIYLLINHCLLTINKIPLNKIKNIYSHPQPFKQCSNFITQFPKWRIHYTKSTTDAMKIVSTYNEITNAALGSEIGSKIYGLEIISKNLSNKKNNITRFIVLHRNPIKISKNINHKTTLLFSIVQELGDLSKILSILKQNKIIMNKCTLQKLNNNAFEEKYYMDIQINLSLNSINNLVNQLKKFTKSIKILGCYPSDNTIFNNSSKNL